MYTSWDIDSNSYEHDLNYMNDMNKFENVVMSGFEASFLAEEVDNKEIDNNPDNAPKQKAPGNKSCFKHVFRNFFCFACSLRN